jgi:hypothetical protein
MVCPEAYNLLAVHKATSYDEALEYYRKAVELGQQVCRSALCQCCPGGKMPRGVRTSSTPNSAPYMGQRRPECATMSDVVAEHAALPPHVHALTHSQ